MVVKISKFEVYFRVVFFSYELRIGYSVFESFSYCFFEWKWGGMNIMVKNGVIFRVGKCGVWYRRYYLWVF